MLLKNKGQMTGRELCDVEGLLFPLLANANDKTGAIDKKVIMEFVTNSGEELALLCYTNNDGSKMTEINGAYRIKLRENFQHITEFFMEVEEKKPTRQKTARKVTTKKQ